jgi:dihydropteridine reductase
VTSIDLVKNDSAKHNVLLNIDASLEEQAKAALEGVSQALGSEKADAVLCVAGGWAGGNAKSTGIWTAILYSTTSILAHILS